MRILFVAPYTPLLTKPRPFNFILHLSKKHDVYLLCFEDLRVDTLSKRPDYQQLRSACQYIEHIPLSRLQKLVNCALSIPSYAPLRVAYYRSAYMHSRMLALIDQHRIDVIHVDRSRLADQVRDIALPKVLDLTDSISWYLAQCIRYSSLPMKPVYFLEYLKVRRYELAAGASFDRCLLTSSLDLKWFRNARFYDRIHVVPNAVGSEFFSDDHVLSSLCAESITFFGNMSYYPNVDAVQYFHREVYPILCRETGPIPFDIVGNQPSRPIRRLQREPNVTVTGYVPSIAQALSRACVVISPLRIGVGFPNKTAEALAMGKAIVSTSAGCRGLGGSRNALVCADDARTFAKGIVHLIRDRDRRTQLENSAREYAHDSLNPLEALAALDRVYAKLQPSSDPTGADQAPEGMNP